MDAADVRSYAMEMKRLAAETRTRSRELRAEARAARTGREVREVRWDEVMEQLA
jgi:hypothetical protein